MAQLTRDLTECVASFNAHAIDYIVVGGFAVAYHGYPRYTGDIDLFVRPERVNLGRVLEALAAFGFPVAVTVDDLLAPDRMLSLGRPPSRVDILTSIDGVSFDAAWAGRVPAVLGGLPVAFIGRAELLVNKGSTGRAKDAIDLERLLSRTPKG